ncbi:MULTISPECIES: hypothetical protein [Nostoc]|uniref:Uncharacterized protein n=1 Tax=Nostoc paludosum FACHB-159 TaxID=2692908 RepID=A0ABR8KMV3_9NOSO|nr:MULTISPECIES: hypothetical protein [Nostoc]MBD2682875.1 hypothetical protein [Nostoc sp. FACHB-857]MBD2739212.1 hypothetical protein [Nostoc paludosum FACHB-159]
MTTVVTEPVEVRQATHSISKNMKKLLKILLKLLPDDTLCLLEEECFQEMEKRKFIIWEEDINNIEQN